MAVVDMPGAQSKLVGIDVIFDGDWPRTGALDAPCGFVELLPLQGTPARILCGKLADSIGEIQDLLPSRPPGRHLHVERVPRSRGKNDPDLAAMMLG